jgi:hypothetical protein
MRLIIDKYKTVSIFLLLENYKLYSKLTEIVL